jgi:hypothetical protein
MASLGSMIVASLVRWWQAIDLYAGFLSGPFGKLSRTA